MDHRDADSGRDLPVDSVSPRAARLVAELREQARVTAASQARELRLVAALSAEVEVAARRELAEGPRVPGQPHDEEVIFDAIEAEVAAALGVSGSWAAHLSGAAEQLSRVLPDTLAALEAGRLDLIRARRLADATESLPLEVARRVESQVLARCGDAPWDGPSPRTWRARIDRTIARLAPDLVRERRQKALADRAVEAWANEDGTGVLRMTTDQMDVAMADGVINDLAMQWPATDPTDPTGDKLSMAQRRVDSFMDVFRRIRDGRDLPSLPVRREHDIGLVVDADTFFDGSPDRSPTPLDGAPAPGELRGLGAATYMDSVSAGELARRQVALGASTTVLLADGQGGLAGSVRLPAPKGGVWTPDTLRSAIYRRLEQQGALPPDTKAYRPTVRQIAYVRARNARCTGYDCPRGSARCDLDHDAPWPRGPTSVRNLAPRCPRHHELKTRRLLRTRLLPGGTLITTMLSGLTVTTRPELLPGYDIGERRPVHLGDGVADDSAA